MLFDKDEDGTITMAELGVVMRSLGQRPSGESLAVRELEMHSECILQVSETVIVMARRHTTPFRDGAARHGERSGSGRKRHH